MAGDVRSSTGGVAFYWRQLAAQVCLEQDSTKFSELVKELANALDEGLHSGHNREHN